jgi:alpha-ketoglutarate-dependent taurine dioxygenase
VIDEVAEQRYLEGEDVTGATIYNTLAEAYPLVWTCPVTNRQALMPHARCMHALAQTSATGIRLLGVIDLKRKVKKLMRSAIVTELVYVHSWQTGDLVIRDKRSTWHSAPGKLSSDNHRVMHLTTFNSADPLRCNWQIGGT